MKRTYWLAVCVVVAGCGGNDSGEPDAGGGDEGNVDAAVAGTDANVDAAAPTFAVGGTVTGFAGSGLVLRLNGSTDLEITGDGAFSFPSPLADGESYEVTVAADPTCACGKWLIPSGTRTRNVVPSPLVLSAATVPPCRRTSS